MSRALSIALVHYPVLHRDGSTITSTVTNLDVHDLSRSARTYGVSAVYIVHPIEAQRELVRRVKGHWTGDGAGARRIPARSDALDLVRIIASLDEALADAGGAELWTTAAAASGPVVESRDARVRLAEPGPPVMLTFGTAWGLAREVLARATVRLAPIDGGSGWNHLSVRAACAITLDRLRGPL